MLRKDHLNLIARHSLKHSLRGGAGLVSIALTLLIGLFLSQCAINPIESIERNFDAEVKRAGGDNLDQSQRDYVKAEANKQVVKLASSAMKWAIDADEDQMRYLTEEQPAMVSVLIVLLFAATPLFACLGGFNQTAGDIGSKGLRFLLFRTERANIYWGRFIGTFVFTALVNLLLFAILAIYMAVKIKVHSPGDTVMWMLQGYLRMMVFTLPYLAVCAWISAAMDSAFGSLAIALLVSFVVPIFFAIAGGMNENIKYAQFITPWGFKYWLLTPIGPKLFGGIAAMGGFTAVFLWLGHRTFTRRDL